MEMIIYRILTSRLRFFFSSVPRIVVRFEVWIDRDILGKLACHSFLHHSPILGGKCPTNQTHKTWSDQAHGFTQGSGRDSWKEALLPRGLFRAGFDMPRTYVGLRCSIVTWLALSTRFGIVDTAVAPLLMMTPRLCSQPRSSGQNGRWTS